MGELTDIAMTREEAIRIIEANCSCSDSKLREACAMLIPELRESKDERIRKNCIHFLELQKKHHASTSEIDECISYLEKQKEQKPVNVDYVSGIRKELLGIEDNAKNIDGLTESQWVAIRAAHRLLGEYVEQEQKPVEIEEIIRKAKSEGRQEVIDNPEYYQLQKPAEQVEINKSLTEAVLAELSKYNGENRLTSPWAMDSTGLQYPLYFANLGATWQKEQKPAWSEEDKQWLSEVYSAIDHSMYSEVERQAMKKYIDYLRYQSQPKQELDEESNKVVLKAVELLNSYGNSLYNGSFEKESNAVYKVADSLKLLSTQPKPEWSENEKRRLKTIAGYLRYKGYEEDAEFIESIPPQQKEEGIKGVKGHPDPAGVWKPSDGQLKALKYFLAHHRLQRDTSTTKWVEYDELQSLYDILCTIAKS